MNATPPLTRPQPPAEAPDRLPHGPDDLRAPGAILLVACYELGHAPLSLALPLAFLERAGFRPEAIDLAVQPLDPEPAARARLALIAVPMHTALRLGVRVATRLRELNPSVRIGFYGLYAVLNAPFLLERVADFCMGGEAEEPIVALAEWLGRGDGSPPPEGVIRRGSRPRPHLARLRFVPPSRERLPPLERYARLEYRGERRVAGYTEASRGCKHHCAHCPIPPVYGGRFFVLPRETVLADVRQQVAAGARHITFGDPDFLNGPGHSLRLLRELHAEFPELTFDFTAKIEHLLAHRRLLPELRALGCLFVVSAAESLSDTVLAILRKGHTRADVEEALRIAEEAGLVLRPTWVPFTPWTTLDDYRELLRFVAEWELVDRIDPVQYSIRLLLPPGSPLVQHPAMQPHLRELDPAAFTYHWEHPDPRMDRLQQAVASRVEADSRAGEDPRRTFHRIRALAEAAAGCDPPGPEPEPRPAADRSPDPRLTEPWFC